MPINKKSLQLLLIVLLGFLVYSVVQKLPEITADPMPWLRGIIIFCAVFTISMVAFRFLKLLRQNTSSNE